MQSVYSTVPTGWVSSDKCSEWEIKIAKKKIYRLYFYDSEKVRDSLKRFMLRFIELNIFALSNYAIIVFYSSISSPICLIGDA